MGSVAEMHATQGLKMAFADQPHMDGMGSSSYEPFFDISTHTSKSSLCSIVSCHGIGPE